MPKTVPFCNGVLHKIRQNLIYQKSLNVEVENHHSNSARFYCLQEEMRLKDAYIGL